MKIKTLRKLYTRSVDKVTLTGYLGYMIKKVTKSTYYTHILQGKLERTELTIKSISYV